MGILKVTAEVQLDKSRTGFTRTFLNFTKRVRLDSIRGILPEVLFIVSGTHRLSLSLTVLSNGAIESSRACDTDVPDRMVTLFADSASNLLGKGL